MPELRQVRYLHELQDGLVSVNQWCTRATDRQGRIQVAKATPVLRGRRIGSCIQVNVVHLQ